MHPLSSTRALTAACLAGAVALISACSDADNPSRPELAGKMETSAPPGHVKPGEEIPVAAGSIAADKLSALSKDPRQALGKSSASGAWLQFVPKDPLADCNFKATLWMDDEDDANANRLSLNGVNYSGKDGYVGGLKRIKGKTRGGNSAITVCQEYIGTMPFMKYDYAVLSGSESCPIGAYRFVRHFDNEDSDNINKTRGAIAPNTAVNSYSRLHFCFVPGDASSPHSFPQAYFASSGKSLEADYMIFAENHAYTTYGFYANDDEDDTNNNSFINVDATDAIFTRFLKVIRGVNGGGNDGRGRNTEMHFAANGTKAKSDFPHVATCGYEPTAPSCDRFGVGMTNEEWRACSNRWSNYEDALGDYQMCIKD